MDVHEAADAVALIRPRVVVPMHRYAAMLIRFTDLVAARSTGTVVAALGIGEPLDLP